MKMIERMLVLMIVAFVPSIALAQTVEALITFDDPQIWMDSQGFSHIEISDTINTGIAGQPSVPVRTIYIALPQGHRVLRVTVDSGVKKVLPGQHVVFPIQPPTPLSRPYSIAFAQPDPGIYLADGVFPVEAFKTVSTQSLMGFAIVPVNLFPVEYDPAQGVLRFSSQMRVTISTEAFRTSQSLIGTFRGYPEDFERVAALVVNPKDLDSYPLKTSDNRGPDYRYVIVTSGAMSNCSGPNNLQALAQEKESRGIPTKIETVENIRSSYSGSDDAAKIRAFLLDMYQNHSAQFALIAGDADLSEVGGETQAPVVAVRYLWGDIGSGADDVPSDLYYSALDGTFNGNNNSVYGEAGDNVDLMAELAVGRAPVDSCSEVANFVKKTLAYEASTNNYLKKIEMVGEYLWGDGSSEEDWGKGYMERIRLSSQANGLDTKGFSENSFFNVSTMYDRDLGGDGAWNSSDILGVINANPHIINHLGHSYTNYNMRMESDDIISGMNNTSYFFEYSQGCYCGSFDNRFDEQYDKQTYWQDSFAEHMTIDEAGAFAVIMNTRYGLGGYSNYFHRLFWDALFRNGQSRLGEMNNASKDQLSGYVSGDAGMRWVYYEATLFGDPEVSIHTSSSAGTDPVIGLPSEAPWFVAIQNLDNPEPQTVSIRNNGGGNMDWQLSWDASWLNVSPTSGTAPTDITLSIDASGLSEGTYETTLDFTAPEATNSPQQLVVTLYIIQVPSVVATYSVSATPNIDGTISSGEYAGASSVDMAAEEGQQAGSVKFLHNGNKLYMAIEVPSDTDSDDYDAIVMDLDADADGLWPSSAGDDGEYQIFADGSQYFAPFYNSGSGIEVGEYVSPNGIEHAFGFSGGHRVVELAIDLSNSHLQRSMGEQFGLFLFEYDHVQDDQFDMLANWPFALQSWDDARYLGKVTIGTDTDNLMANPASLYFETEQGADPTEAVQLTITSTTANSLSFSLSSGASWLHTSPTSGSTPAVVNVWADPSGLSIGPKSGNISISSSGASNSPMSVPVTFQVNAAPASLSAYPSALGFQWIMGNAAPSPKTFVISNQTGPSVNWTATLQCDWATLSSTSGSTPSTITVTPVVQNLHPGFKAGKILLSTPGSEPVQVDLGIEVRSQAHISVSPQLLEKYDPLSTQSVEAEFYISNSEWGTMDWSVAESSDWISLSPTSGTYVTSHPSLVTATLNPAGLNAGVHEASITITAQGADNSPQTMTLRWTLEEGPAISVSPHTLSFQAQENGSNPSSKTLQISNSGQGPLNYTLDCQPQWLSCSPTSGSAPGSTSVSVSVNGLSAGMHTGTVTIGSAEAINSPSIVEVSLLVNQGQSDNRPPPAPVLLSPQNQATLPSPNPELIVQNVVDPDGDVVTYTFEVYPMGQATPWTTIERVSSGQTNTSAAIVKTLNVGVPYEWRARAVDSKGLEGPWSNKNIFDVLKPDEGGGCACSSSGNSGPSGLIMLALMLGLAMAAKKK